MISRGRLIHLVGTSNIHLLGVVGIHARVKDLLHHGN